MATPKVVKFRVVEQESTAPQTVTFRDVTEERRLEREAATRLHEQRGQAMEEQWRKDKEEREAFDRKVSS